MRQYSSVDAPIAERHKVMYHVPPDAGTHHYLQSSVAKKQTNKSTLLQLLIHKSEEHVK